MLSLEATDHNPLNFSSLASNSSVDFKVKKFLQKIEEIARKGSGKKNEVELRKEHISEAFLFTLHLKCVHPEVVLTWEAFLFKETILLARQCDSKTTLEDLDPKTNKIDDEHKCVF